MNANTTHRSRSRPVLSHEMAELVHDAIAGSGVTLVFQPIFDLREFRDGGRSPIGVEALARFGTPGSPQPVFDEAGRMGLGIDLELACLRAAIGYLSQLPAGMFLGVNMTAAALASGQASTEIPPDEAERVVLDVVAGSRVADGLDQTGFDQLATEVSTLRRVGVRVALDDVAVAVEEVADLVLLPFDILKLDREAVSGIDADVAKQVSARAIVDLAETIGAHVMAEAIETEREAAELVEQGVLFGQGFHLGRPAAYGEWADPLPVGKASQHTAAAGRRASDSGGELSREKLLASALDRAPVVVWAIDLDGVFTVSEGGGLAALGLETGEVVGRSVFEMYAGNASVLEPTRAALAGTASESVMRVGSQVFRTSYAPLRDAQGKVVGASGMAANLTDSVRAQESVERSEARRLALFETSPVGIWIGNGARLIDVNARYVDMFGFASKEETLSSDPTRLWPSPGHRERFLNRVREDGVVHGFETQLVTSTGRSVLARVSARYLDETGEIEGIVEDITQEAEARAAVADSERRFRTLFESAPVALQVEDFTEAVAWLDGLDVTPDGLAGYFSAHPEKITEGLGLIRVTDANPAAATLFGCSRSQLLGPLAQRSALPAFADPEAVTLRAIANREATFERNTTTQTHDGTMNLQILWTMPGRDSTLDFSQVIVAFEDVTTLTETTRRAQELTEIKERLIASVSHELRTPLAAVVGFAALLEGGQSSLTEAETTEAIQLIASTSRQMSGIVEDLLTSTKIDVGTPAVALAMINLADEARAALATCDTNGRHVSLPLGSTRAWADKGRTRQIIRNLITNAVRHGHGDIHIEAANNDHQATVRVTDHGDGVAPGDAHKLFDLYWSGHNAPGHTNSLGLGLALSRTLARLMNGDLTYERHNADTIFELTLPTSPDPLLGDRAM